MVDKNARLQVEDWSNAIGDFSRVIDSAPSNLLPQAYYQRGWAYYQTKQYPESIADLDRAVEMGVAEASHLREIVRDESIRKQAEQEAMKENINTEPNQEPTSTPNAVYQAGIKFAESLKEKLQREVVFLLMGRTGVGKTSTMNNLMGCEVGLVGDFEPTTMTVEGVKLPIDGIYDSPGLCDELPEKGNDREYIDKIQDKIKYVDIFLFVTELQAKRVGSDEQYGIKLITKAFGEKIWASSVIVFTGADNIKPELYEHTLSERTRLIRKEIQKNLSTPEIAQDIPSVAVDNFSDNTPDGKPWVGELYATISERMSQESFVQWLMATAPKNIWDDSESPKVIKEVVEKPIYIYIDKPSKNNKEEKKEKQKKSGINRELNKDQQKRVEDAASQSGIPTNHDDRKSFMAGVIDGARKIGDQIAQEVKKGIKTVKGWFGLK
jgi:GTPase Era involved in 16S rRNA processing